MSSSADDSPAGAVADDAGRRGVELLGRLDAALEQLGGVQDWQQEVETLQAELDDLRRHSAEQARRSSAEHAAQLLGLQQRVSNERDALNLAHAERLADLQAEATRTRESIENAYRGLLAEARADADQAREEARQAREQRDRNAREAEALDAQLGVERVRRVEVDTQITALREELALARAAAAEAEARRAAEQASRAAAELQLAARDVELAHARDLIEALSGHAAALASSHDAALEAERGARRDAERRAADALANRALEAPPSAPKLQQPGTAVRDADGLLALEGTRFIAAAYAALLGREPDAAGREAYLGRLREGISKAEILRSMVESEEGQRVDARLPGLEDRLAETRPTRPGWLGRLFLRAERATLRPAGQAQALTAAANRLGLLQEALEEHSRQLSESEWNRTEGDRRLLSIEQALRDFGVDLRSVQAGEERVRALEQRLDTLSSVSPDFNAAVSSLQAATAAARALAPPAAPCGPAVCAELPAAPAQRSEATDEPETSTPTAQAAPLPAAAVIERARRLLRRQRGRGT